MPVRFAPVNGVEMSYHVRGAGHPVVFIHGGDGNQFCWWRQVPALSREFTCLAYDQRGHGLSMDVDDRPGAEAWVEDLAGLLDHLGLDEVSIVGHSLGGWTATGFASTYPERVASLVLADSTGGLMDPDETLAVLDDAREGTEGGSEIELLLREEAVDDEIAHRYSLLTSINRGHGASGPARAKEIIEQHRRWGAPSPDTIVGGGIPVFLLAGEHDVVTPVERLRRVRSRLGADALTVVDGASHSLHFEKPATFNGHVRAFLETVVE